MTTQTAAVAIERRFVDEEHRRLRVGLASLQDALLEPRLPTRSEAIERVVRTLQWLRRDVLPHASWEEAWLYSHVDAAAGTPWATRALRFEHEQIRDVAGALETEFQAAEARWTTEHAYRIVVGLTRLETLLAAHLLQEERLIMPTLDETD